MIIKSFLKKHIPKIVFVLILFSLYIFLSFISLNPLYALIITIIIDKLLPRLYILNFSNFINGKFIKKNILDSDSENTMLFIFYLYYLSVFLEIQFAKRFSISPLSSTPDFFVIFVISILLFSTLLLILSGISELLYKKTPKKCPKYRKRKRK